jgi:hypothetical protein
MTLDELAEKLKNGSITIAEWESSMRDFLRKEYETTLILAKGGRENITQSDWGYEGSLLKKQYAYLSDFAKEISANPTAWMNGRLNVRMNMYGESAYSALEDFRSREYAAQGCDEEENELGGSDNNCDGCLTETGRGRVAIGSLVPVGSRDCIVNCRCTIRFYRQGVLVG